MSQQASNELDAAIDLSIAAINSNSREQQLERHCAALAGALRGLKEQVESLDDYSLTRDTEPYKAQACWDNAQHTAFNALAAYDKMREGK